MTFWRKQDLFYNDFSAGTSFDKTYVESDDEGRVKRVKVEFKIWRI